MIGDRLEKNMQLLKDLVGLNIFESTHDMVLEHYLNKAELSIKNYLHYSIEEMGELFDTIIVDLAKYYYKNRKSTGIIQESQGSRSQTLERGIPKEIIDSLPMPRVQIIG